MPRTSIRRGGGHGFNTGIGDAVNIGWKLAAVLGGWGGENLLASYEAERRPVAEQTIQEAAANMSVLAPELGNPEIMTLGLTGSCDLISTSRGTSVDRPMAEAIITQVCGG